MQILCSSIDSLSRLIQPHLAARPFWAAPLRHALTCLAWVLNNTRLSPLDAAQQRPTNSVSKSTAPLFSATCGSASALIRTCTWSVCLLFLLPPGQQRPLARSVGQVSSLTLATLRHWTRKTSTVGAGLVLRHICHLTRAFWLRLLCANPRAPAALILLGARARDRNVEKIAVWALQNP